MCRFEVLKSLINLNWISHFLRENFRHEFMVGVWLQQWGRCILFAQHFVQSESPAPPAAPSPRTLSPPSPRTLSPPPHSKTFTGWSHCICSFSLGNIRANWIQLYLKNRHFVQCFIGLQHYIINKLSFKTHLFKKHTCKLGPTLSKKQTPCTVFHRPTTLHYKQAFV